MEITAVIFAFITVHIYFEKYGYRRTILFFAPLLVSAVLFEGLFIYLGYFKYVGFNFYLLNVPLAIILYWFGAYYLYLLYKHFGKTWRGRLKAALIHFLIDSLITTPLAIWSGYWVFSTTLFNHYPYLPLPVHFGEVLYGLVFIIVQEKLDILNSLK